MSQQVKKAGTIKQYFQKGNFKGIMLLGYLFGATNNVAIGNNGGFNTDEIDVEIVLERAGRKHEIYSGPLQPLLVGQNILDSMFPYYHPLSSSERHITTKTEGASNVEEAIQPLYIDFGTVINLDGADKLYVRTKVQNSALSATCDSALSYIEVSPVEGIGLEYYTPKFECLVLDADQSKFEKTLGNNIKEVAFVNMDQTSAESDDKVLKTIRLTSDRLDIDDTWEELVAKRLRMFEEVSDASARIQNFLIASVQEMDNVVLRATLDETLVATSQCYFYVSSFETNASTYNKAESKRRKFAGRLAGKVR